MQNNQYHAKGFVVWGVCALFFLYEFFLRTVLGTFQVPLMSDLDLSAFEFSLLSSSFFLIIYGIMQIPVGLIVDNMGLKKSLIIGSVACGIGTLGFAYSNNYILAIIFRMFMGFGSSFGFICLLVSVYDWMPKRRITMFMGLSQFIGTMGPMIAAGPLSTVTSSGSINWQQTFIGLSAIGFGLTALSAVFVKNNTQKKGHYIILRKPQKIYESISRLFRKSQPWYIAIVSAVIYFPAEYLSENEGRIFLSLKGINLDTASYMITFLWIGFAIFCPILGIISDVIHRRKIILTFSAFTGLISMTMIVYLTDIYALFAGFFLLGISASGQVIGFATIAENFKKEYTAIALSLNNAVIITSASVLAPILGLLLEDETGSVTLSSYVHTFPILIVLSLAAFIVSAIFLKETYCKPRFEFTLLRG